jgi:peptidoglycan-N-acetylglucosamine deacetylase
MTAPRPFFVTASFDDGHEDDLVVAEALLKRGAKATFYVALNAGRGGPEISSSTVRRLAALGMEIGSHTARHQILKGRSYDDVLQDLVDGRRGVEDMLGGPVAGLSYPEGVHDDLVVRAAREAGFKYARTTVAFRTTPTGDSFRLPVTVEFERKSTVAHARHAARDGNVAGLFHWLLDARLATDPVAMSRAFASAASRRGGFLHLRSRSWEIVKNDLLSPLDEAIAHALSLQGAVPVVNAATA